MVSTKVETNSSPVSEINASSPQKVAEKPAANGNATTQGLSGQVDAIQSSQNSQEHQKLRETGSTQTSIAMGEYNGAEYIVINEVPSPRANHGQKISLLPLVFLIFYEVSGGPFGVEDSVNAAGPLLASFWVFGIPIHMECSRSFNNC
ncbi:putative polyamine transporter [Forsythia ovata]|uniref:Polyamine transporter n=1 Tax=Forsythia ovata TaxID=205694 RepID=A0ABD1W3A2_9LAMI